MTTDPLTWAAVGAVLVFAGLPGGAAVLVWRLYAGPWRWLAAIATVGYYAALAYTHPPALTAVLKADALPHGDAIRSIAATLAFGLGLLMVAWKAREKNDQF